VDLLDLSAGTYVRTSADHYFESTVSGNLVRMHTREDQAEPGAVICEEGAGQDLKTGSVISGPVYFKREGNDVASLEVRTYRAYVDHNQFGFYFENVSSLLDTLSTLKAEKSPFEAPDLTLHEVSDSKYLIRRELTEGSVHSVLIIQLKKTS
jgi:hypothetical protein